MFASFTGIFNSNFNGKFCLLSNGRYLQNTVLLTKLQPEFELLSGARQKIQ